jgi:ABC-type transporter Mla subunit MlaD
MKPPGITTADTLSNQPLEPPLKPGAREINIDQVNAETKELQILADALPGQIKQVESNQLPKDLETNLKQIEKLAKHLRSQLTP